MALAVTECLPEQHATLPEIFYKDDNVTVYAFTVSKAIPSTGHEPSTGDMAALGQKRKMSPEVDRPSKIAKASDSNGLTPDEIPRKTIPYMFMSKESGSNLVRCVFCCLSPVLFSLVLENSFERGWTHRSRRLSPIPPKMVLSTTPLLPFSPGISAIINTSLRCCWTSRPW